MANETPSNWYSLSHGDEGRGNSFRYGKEDVKRKKSGEISFVLRCQSMTVRSGKLVESGSGLLGSSRDAVSWYDLSWDDWRGASSWNFSNTANNKDKVQTDEIICRNIAGYYVKPIL